MHCEIYEIQGSKMYEQKSTEKMEEEMEVHCFKVLIFQLKYKLSEGRQNCLKMHSLNPRASTQEINTMRYR